MSEHKESIFGPFRLLRRIGAGGMAEVFEAVRVDGEGGRVALKRVLAELAGDADFARMFADEITIASRIRADEVLRVIDACPTPPTQYLALELVDGIDCAALQRHARTGGAPLSTSALAYIGARVARGLHAAHEARDEHGAPMGVVHRDVSPANMFVSADGAVKLGDFGVAYARERATRTVSGVVKGTVSFMAPEQFSGLAVDRRADVFALGCALHAIATGHSPVRSVEDLVRIVRDGALALDESLPDALRPALDRALRATPSERFDTALAFADALAALCVDEAGARSELSSLCAALSASAPAAPRFDALWSLDAMGLEPIEPSGPPTAATVRARPERTPTAAPEPTPLAAKQPARGRWIALALLPAAALLGVAQLRARPAPMVQARTAPPWTPPIAPAVTIDAAIARRSPPAPVLDDAATVHVESQPIDSSVRRPWARRAVTDASSSANDPGAARGATAIEAWIRVGFEGASVGRARLFIDGLEQGWAPARVRVAAGRRRLVVRDTEGRALFDEVVTVGEEHTRLSPRAVLVRAIAQ